jgi:hypothetical protein
VWREHIFDDDEACLFKLGEIACFFFVAQHCRGERVARRPAAPPRRRRRPPTLHISMHVDARAPAGPPATPAAGHVAILADVIQRYFRAFAALFFKKEMRYVVRCVTGNVIQFKLFSFSTQSRARPARAACPFSI